MVFSWHTCWTSKRLVPRFFSRWSNCLFFTHTCRSNTDVFLDTKVAYCTAIVNLRKLDSSKHYHCIRENEESSILSHRMGCHFVKDVQVCRVREKNIPCATNLPSVLALWMLDPHISQPTKLPLLELVEWFPLESLQSAMPGLSL